MILALVGNQNCGKTTLFNQLTGANQHVGNFPGVTVESKEGAIKNVKNYTVVDLPGIYSLSPYTNEEIVTRDFITKMNPDGIINIVDATNIERNLYLSLQLMDMGLPMVIALNMMDEVRDNGGHINCEKMSEALGIPVIPISASKNEGISDLIDAVTKLPKKGRGIVYRDFCRGAVHRTIHAITVFVEDHAVRAGVSPRFAATKIAEGDKLMLNALELSENEKETVEHTLVEMENEMKTDRKAAIADMRYVFIEKLTAQTVTKPKENKQHKRSVKIDNVLTNKYLAIPLFIVIMLTVFAVSFGTVGQYLSDLLSDGIQAVGTWTVSALDQYGLNPIVRSLISDGIINGVGSVLSFLPIVILLFFFLSLLEDTGYMARIAFVMDRPLRKIGLSGRSFVPMLIGFGCSVPAIMSARTLSGERDRKMTIFLVPFMSCSAKLPIYAAIANVFFPGKTAVVMICLYVLGILLGILSAAAFKMTGFKGNSVPFVMELPNYRLPSLKSVFQLMWDKAKDFLVRAFTIIFVASIVIWFLQTFDARLNAVSDPQDSILAMIGQFISPIFAPLGFGDWRMSTALITGFTAKEAVISTINVLFGSESAIRAVLSSAAAVSFLVFTLIYTPCIAAVNAVRKELGSIKYSFFVIIYQTGIAWLVSYIVYKLAGLFL